MDALMSLFRRINVAPRQDVCTSGLGSFPVPFGLRHLESSPQLAADRSCSPAYQEVSGRRRYLRCGKSHCALYSWRDRHLVTTCRHQVGPAYPLTTSVFIHVFMSSLTLSAVFKNQNVFDRTVHQGGPCPEDNRSIN